MSASILETQAVPETFTPRFGPPAIGTAHRQIAEIFSALTSQQMAPQLRRHQPQDRHTRQDLRAELSGFTSTRPRRAYTSTTRHRTRCRSSVYRSESGFRLRRLRVFTIRPPRIFVRRPVPRPGRRPARQAGPRQPEFLYVDGAEAAWDPDARRKVYANLLVSHWAMAWDLGMISIPTLRANASRLLREDVARQWWQAWKFSYRTSRGRKRFVEIMEGEHERAASAPKQPGRGAVPKRRQSPEPLAAASGPDRSSRSRTFMVGCAVGFAMGAVTVRSLPRH